MVIDEIEIVEEKVEGDIKVIGVGGAGCNALDTMIEEGIDNVDYIALNTDSQALSLSRAAKKIVIGREITGGEGAGIDPELGRTAAMADRECFRELMEGARMVFLTAGMGGGTGTGASPVVAEVSKEMEIPVVAVVTKPFHFEGKTKMALAEEGIENLLPNVDSVIVIPNEKLIQDARERKDKNDDIDLEESFRLSDMVLTNAVRGVVEIITCIGKNNADFADVKTMLKNKGRIFIGMGKGKGENREIDAVREALNNPFVEDSSFEGAMGILVNIVSDRLRTTKFDESMKLITEEADPDFKFKFGFVKLPELNDEVRVTIIVAGFDRKGPRKSSARIAESPQLMKGSGGIASRRVAQMPLGLLVDIPLTEEVDFSKKGEEGGAPKAISDWSRREILKGASTEDKGKGAPAFIKRSAD